MKLSYFDYSEHSNRIKIQNIFLDFFHVHIEIFFLKMQKF